MRRSRSASRWLVAAAAVLLAPLHVWAADPEVRVFSINIDGKKSGDYSLTIQSQSDGSVTVAAASDVRVTLLGVPVYTYSYRGRELWKAGRLHMLESSGKEKGNPFSVRADLDGTALRVKANGQERSVRADAWATSCWQLPAGAGTSAAVPMLGCDNGAELQGRLEYVGTEQVKILGQMQTCKRYRVTKDVPHDIWYDAQGRLVRDEWQSSGHRTVLELTELRR